MYYSIMSLLCFLSTRNLTASNSLTSTCLIARPAQAGQRCSSKQTAQGPSEDKRVIVAISVLSDKGPIIRNVIEI
jgi:hypothetical protein